jgi:hypothetical protein
MQLEAAMGAWTMLRFVRNLRIDFVNREKNDDAQFLKASEARWEGSRYERIRSLGRT